MHTLTSGPTMFSVIEGLLVISNGETIREFPIGNANSISGDVLGSRVVVAMDGKIVIWCDDTPDSIVTIESDYAGFGISATIEKNTCVVNTTCGKVIVYNRIGHLWSISNVLTVKAVAVAITPNCRKMIIASEEAMDIYERQDNDWLITKTMYTGRPVYRLSADDSIIDATYSSGSKVSYDLNSHFLETIQ